MTIAFLVLAVISCAVIYPAYFVSRRRGAESRLLVIAPLPAVVVWVSLTALGYGAQSLSNLVEVLTLFALGIALAYIKVFVMNKWFKQPLRSTYALVALLVLAAFVLRTTMPNLPE